MKCGYEYELIEEDGKKFLLMTRQPIKVDLEKVFGGKENIPDNIEEMVKALGGNNEK